ncbi:ABC transporter substrate-binding protein (plasmid) [Arthrobacter sp. UC242_113]|uniref:ABC transporter substrate-binding protein n=1 Tax=Arthrobacter sp. UC242_113 TaxID=3374550 RepID=UPI00375654C7
MKISKAAIPVGALVAAASLALTGCAGGTSASAEDASQGGLPQEIKSSGKLRVGLSPDFPPMEFKDSDNKLIGADIELGQKLGEILGVQIEVVESPFEQLMNSVQTGRVDLVISGVSDTLERQKTVDFIDYFQSQARIYTTAARAGEFTKQSDVCGKQLAVSSSAEQYQQVKDLNKSVCVDNGLPEIKILATDSGSSARLQIEQGRADLAAQGGENLAYFMKQEPGKYAPVLEPLPAEPFGVVVAKGSTQLAEAIKDGFSEMKSSGDYQKILDKWKLGYGAMDPEINSVK